MDLDRLKEIFDELLEIYRKKNHDYGDSVESTFKKYGLISFLVRIEDKINRLGSLVKNKSLVTSESIEDTLLDLANYAAIACMMVRKYKTGNDKYYKEALINWFNSDDISKSTFIPYEIQEINNIKEDKRGH